MAVTVTLDDCTKPIGPLDPKTLWPDDEEENGFDPDAEDWIDKWLTEGKAKAVDVSDAVIAKAAVIQWVCYRAYADVYQTMVRMPSTVDVPTEGSASTLITQITLMQELRDQALAEFQKLLALDVAKASNSAPLRKQSRSTPAEFRW